LQEGLCHTEEEHQNTEGGDVGTDRGNLDPQRIGIREVRIAAGHTLQAKEVLREEDEVHTDKGDPEVELPNELGIHVTEHLGEPVVPACKYGEDRTERQDVVEVSHNVIGVMQRTVHTRIGKHHARHTTNGEQEDEANGPVHGRTEVDRTAPHGGNP